MPADRRVVKRYIYVCSGPNDSHRLSEWFGEWLADFKRPNCFTQESWVWFNEWLYSDEIGKWLDTVIAKCRSYATWNDEQLARAVAEGADYFSCVFSCSETAKPVGTMEFLSKGLPIFADEPLVGRRGHGRQLLECDCVRQSGFGRALLLPVPPEKRKVVREAVIKKNTCALYNFARNISGWMPFYCPLCFCCYAPEHWLSVPSTLKVLHDTTDALCPLGHARPRGNPMEFVDVAK